MVGTVNSESRRQRFGRVAVEALESLKTASDLIDGLCRGRETCQLYAVDHQFSENMARELLGKIRALFYNRRVVSIDVGVRRFLYNSLPIYEASKVGRELHQAMREMKVGGITFTEGVGRQDIYHFLHLLGQATMSHVNRDWLTEQMAAAGVTKITLEPPMVEDLTEEDDSAGGAGAGSAAQSLIQQRQAQGEAKDFDNACKTYQIAVGMIKDVMHSAHQPDQINLKDITTLAETIVTGFRRFPDELIAAAIGGRIEHYQFLHPVNVAIFSLAVADSLPRDLQQLVELARIALLYDVGKSHVLRPLLSKSETLTPEEVADIQKHPFISADLLDRHTGLEKLAVVVAFEHHLTASGGYPATVNRWETNVITRIIRVTEAFDALISNSVFREAIAPHAAVAKLAKEWKGQPENQFLRFLAKRLGLFPAGLVVMLSSGEMAMVVSQTENRPLYPVVQVLAGANQVMLDKPELRRTSPQCAISSVVPTDALPFNPLTMYPFGRQAAAAKANTMNRDPRP